MAESSSKETATPSAPIQLQPQSISFKHTDDNYLIWRQQILTTVRGLGLEHYLVGSEIPPQFLQSENEEVLNPAYLAWNRQSTGPASFGMDPVVTHRKCYGACCWYGLLQRGVECFGNQFFQPL